MLVAVALYVTLMLPDTLYHVFAVNDLVAAVVHVPGVSAVPQLDTVLAEAVPALVVLIKYCGLVIPVAVNVTFATCDFK